MLNVNSLPHIFPHGLKAERREGEGDGVVVSAVSLWWGAEGVLISEPTPTHCPFPGWERTLTGWSEGWDGLNKWEREWLHIFQPKGPRPPEIFVVFWYYIPLYLIFIKRYDFYNLFEVLFAHERCSHNKVTRVTHNELSIWMECRGCWSTIISRFSIYRIVQKYRLHTGREQPAEILWHSAL